MISGKTSVYGILGYPVAHSFSPEMHNAAFKKLGMDACYVPFAVPPEKLESAVRAVIPLGLRGLNVTVPHKERVLKHLDGLSDEARLIGAVNTIEVTQGKLIGHNTDGRGFLRALKEHGVPKGRNIVFVGAGGAARAVSFSLALAGVASIAFCDLDVRKASLLAKDIREKTSVPAVAIEQESLPEHAAEADYLINATPLGLKRKDPLPIPAKLVQKKHLIADLVYNPPDTALLKMARKQGARVLPGLGMLLYQGVIAFEIWTGEKAPIRTMKNALSRQIR
jgi:shikimate dehydrogenase